MHGETKSAAVVISGGHKRYKLLFFEMILIFVVRCRHIMFSPLAGSWGNDDGAGLNSLNFGLQYIDSDESACIERP